MDEARFWSLIDQSLVGARTQDAQASRLSGALARLSAEEIAAFHRIFEQQMAKSYSWDLWAAAYIIHGGASDDGFEYFRRWLVSRGRAVFEAALRDPDTLASAIPPRQDEAVEFESFGYIARDLWAAKAGVDILSADPSAMAATRSALGDLPNYSAEPSGSRFEEDEDHLAERLPRLWARFGEAPLE